MLEEIINSYVESHAQETIELLKALTAIPAPTGDEGWRAEFCRNWLQSQGVEDVIQDQAGNVICLYGSSKDCDLLVVSAHMDTVFADTQIEVQEADGKLYAPGIGDDTANLVNMLMTIKFLTEHLVIPEGEKLKMGILFAANVGEEGLGNLKGSRSIFEAYQDRIRYWISFDLYYNTIYDHAVGSQRYQVTLRGKGGHSYRDFGNANAVAQAADIVHELYQQEVPTEAKTTYNVGKMQGGTAVNAIAEEAEILYEFRSQSNECLQKMEQNFCNILQKHRDAGEDVSMEILGMRPGNGKVDPKGQQRLNDCALTAIGKYYAGTVSVGAASTDCNIPLSAGIPAVTMGTVLGAGLHTKEEWIEKDSMIPGQKMAIYAVLLAMNLNEHTPA